MGAKIQIKIRNQATPITDSVTILSVFNYFFGIMTTEAWFPAARTSAMNF